MRLQLHTSRHTLPERLPNCGRSSAWQHYITLTVGRALLLPGSGSSRLQCTSGEEVPILLSGSARPKNLGRDLIAARRGGL